MARKIKLELSIESQKELLDLSFELKIITKEKYDSEIKKLEPKYLDAFFG